MATPSTSADPGIDPRHFRDVLGCYPTGVCVVTSELEGARHGFVIGSFTSISLVPPIVGFFPDKSSTSWPRIAATGRFCVNVLGASQLDLCQRFASRLEYKFDGLVHRHTPGGLPLIDGAVAWIECRIASVQEIGDHLLVVGAVEALDKGDPGMPLLFFRGGYHGLHELDMT
jgi:3-hydroxy-9,10-secoandrosta-1,3,5(10)-triene-9,17-dione monooxygenase reductase component